VQTYAFRECVSLTTVVLPACETLGSSAFYSDRSLTSLYLLNQSSVVSLGANAFYGTPFASSQNTTAKVYVHEAMFDGFVTNSAWSSYSSAIVSMTQQEIDQFLA
jgi:hypothetical protein